MCPGMELHIEHQIQWPKQIEWEILGLGSSSMPGKWLVLQGHAGHEKANSWEVKMIACQLIQLMAVS